MSQRIVRTQPSIRDESGSPSDVNLSSSFSNPHHTFGPIKNSQLNLPCQYQLNSKHSQPPPHQTNMVPIRFSALLVAATSALALQGHADAAPCDADNYSKVAAAVQTLHSNCAGWAAYLASGGVWTCDSTCRDAVTNLVDTLPDCTFGGPYGQNYKQVVEGMVATCNGAVPAGSDLTAATSSTTAAPADSTATPSSTTAAPSVNTNSSNNNSTESATSTTTTAPSTTTSTDNKDSTDNDSSASTNTNASASAGAADTPASEVATTSGASSQSASAMAAVVLVIVGSLLH